jgi:hypothetical protein
MMNGLCIALFLGVSVAAFSSDSLNENSNGARNLDEFQGHLSLYGRLHEQDEANPMRKIISMLQDMEKELTREQEMESELFEKAMCTCENGEKQLKTVIEESKTAIETLTAKVSGGTAEKARLAQEITDHKAQEQSTTADLAQAVALREKEYKKFVAEEKDSKKNLANLGQAIPAIEQGMGGASLMQTPVAPRLRRMIEVSKYIRNADRSTVLAFLDQGEDDGEAVKSGGAGEILGILKNMKDEMQKDLGELQKQQEIDLNDFNELKAAKEQEISLNKRAIITKEKRSGALALELSEDSHALKDAKEELENASNFLATMDEQCAKAKANRDMRAKMRADEIAALGEAIKILNDDDALDVFKKAAPSAALMQQQKQTYDALVQLRESGTRLQGKKHKLVLASVSSHVRQHEEPFEGDQAHNYDGKGGVGEFAGEAEKMVVHMVDGMVGVLHDEDVGDEHKKAWCANETEITLKIQGEKKTLLAQTDSEISEMSDQVASLTEEIKSLTSQIQATDKMVHEATVQRKDEHQEFVDSFATMATALRLLDKAMTRLHKFYHPEKYAAEKKAVTDAAIAKAGLGLSQTGARQPAAQFAAVARLKALGADFDAFMQTHSKLYRVDPIVIPDTPTTYEKKESGGVMGLMNDFKTDLKTDMTEAEMEEKFAAKEYVRIMSEAQASRAGDVKALNEKKATKATLEEKLVSAKALHMQTDKEIHNIELYLVQLHTECDFLLRNFEVRHEGRVSEETGLEEAETIVTHADVPTHTEVEKVYKEEHSQDDVDEHWPGKFGGAAAASEALL